ncbi:carbon-nitrogen family hydrolase [Chengkuizengella axinellae]|uniref:Carbon-nitrogen family hydrolase n=1 Tax=Chengkuizengella axinellae TaxID=3064388 RepID=A0ABT9IXN7_9BACL|nr:carbon-nitrogen family hydrolase [Chengkuizengella sp. 2205SS18-9]MDP5273887.1 carbon-nitrogen family hydrolase [Chengkuizengella sp. 2205SS18-9]
MMVNWNISCLQFDVKKGLVEENINKVTRMIENAVASSDKPDVILIPEMWNTSFIKNVSTLAETYGERTKQFISEMSQKHQVHIVAGSISEKINGKVHNISYVCNPSGNFIADYSKIHLFQLMYEDRYYVGGNSVGIFELFGTKVGMVICYDIRFPELVRKLALEGVKVLFVPAQWPDVRLHHWRTLLMARAIENQMYVVACNRIGSSGREDFPGHSMIISPWGEVIKEADDKETILQATIDLDIVQTVRDTIPVFEDRRPSLY